jgi:aspartate ammonia-lyase
MPVEHIEQDALGEVRVPDDVYYGVQTQRAPDNPMSSPDYWTRAA